MRSGEEFGQNPHLRGYRKASRSPTAWRCQGTNVMQLAEGKRLSTRFRTVLRGPDGAYVVDLAVIFEFDEPAEFDPDAVREFVGSVAFPIAHPFIREALRDMASRLGLKRPMLELLPPEGISLEEPSSEEAPTNS